MQGKNQKIRNITTERPSDRPNKNKTKKTRTGQRNVYPIEVDGLLNKKRKIYKHEYFMLAKRV